MNTARDGADGAPESPFLVDIDGFEGPIDLLLALARDHKLDLTQISILALAEQYLAFIRRARRLRIELAADYLVMAAWLAYLKSRLLLPEKDDEPGPSGEQMAEALAFQLRRLEALREVGRRLIARPLLGRDVFARGVSEARQVIEKPVYALGLHDLVRAYAHQRRRRQGAPALAIEESPLHTLEAALQRLSMMIGSAIEWTALVRFLPEGLGDGLVARSALAATFAASLELAREGRVEIHQDSTFGPVFVHRREEGET